MGLTEVYICVKLIGDALATMCDVTLTDDKKN